ncbi:MAG TPA: hypothetical protein DEP69_06880 [Acidimicrobiaceae bacterium]|nr:hypothetical protein [Acidimicrobiaceae bacterium]
MRFAVVPTSGHPTPPPRRFARGVPVPTPQPAIFAGPGRSQWYLHLSRAGYSADEAGNLVGGSSDPATLAVIRAALAQLRADCDDHGVNLLIAFGPTLLADLTDEAPADFQPYTTIESADGSSRRAVATQEEMLLWLHHSRTDTVWKAQYDVRTALAPQMAVARETPAFVLGPSLDMTGFEDGIANRSPDEAAEVALVPDGEPGAGGSHVIAQRWVHDLEGWNRLPVPDQESIIGREKHPGRGKLADQAPHSHLRHTELREDGRHGLSDSEERDEMFRRSAPYAFHDGTVGLYFVGFSSAQAPLRERMDLMYGHGAANGIRDGLTNFSQPASGSFYFAPSRETLSDICAG